MEFIKRMKKREFIEMGLKLAIGLLIGIIVIFFMEAMINSIYIKKIKENTSVSGNVAELEYYIDNLDNGKYDVYTHYRDSNEWARLTIHTEISKEKLDAFLKEAGDMYGFPTNRYKIVANDGSADITFELNAASQAPIDQVKANAETLNTGYTFSISTKDSAEASYETAHEDLTYEELVALFEAPGAFVEASTTKIFWRRPHCFDVYMNGWHYVVMVLFLAAISGVFVWRFLLINKEYKKIEKRFKKTGKVF